MPDIFVGKTGVKVRVDEKYLPIFTPLKWTWAGGKTCNQRYAAMRIGGKTVYMHRLIMQIESGRSLGRKDEVDHINGDALDNRVCNLRLCVHHENTMHQGRRKDNKSGYIGVFHDTRKGRKPYHALIECGKTIHLGGFDTPEAAAVQRDLGALKYFGEFATLNYEDRRSEYIETLANGYDPEQATKDKKLKKTSQYLGVWKDPRCASWLAKYHLEYLGSFHTEEEAARAYDAKAKELKGDKAKLNFP
jgi:hypothetical protein